MKVGSVSHVGIAVRDFDRAVRQYRLLTGVADPVIEDVPDQQVKVAIFSGAAGENDCGRIELLTPTSDRSPISSFLDKRGEGLHHLCIYVKDLQSHLDRLKAAGITLIDDTPRTGAEGRRIAFVHPSGANGVLIELEEISPRDR